MRRGAASENDRVWPWGTLDAVDLAIFASTTLPPVPMRNKSGSNDCTTLSAYLLKIVKSLVDKGIQSFHN